MANKCRSKGVIATDLIFNVCEPLIEELPRLGIETQPKGIVGRKICLA